MGHDSNQDLGVEGRSDELNIPPDRFDFITDEKHPLYDPRVKMPLDLEMLESIRALALEKGPSKAIKERVTAYRNGAGRVIVNKGRMRVRCALKLAEEGVKVLVPTKIVRYLDDAEAYEDLVRENEERNETPPTMRAQQAQKMIDFGRDKAHVARMFRFKTVNGLELLLGTLDLDPKVRKLVDKGSISFSLAATELRKFPLEAQVEEAARPCFKSTARDSATSDRMTRPGTPLWGSRSTVARSRS